MIHQPDTGLAQDWIRSVRLADSFCQRKFEQVTDRDPQPGLTLAAKEKMVDILAQRSLQAGFIGEQIVGQDRGGVFSQQASGKTDPGILPDLSLIHISEPTRRTPI